MRSFHKSTVTEIIHFIGNPQKEQLSLQKLEKLLKFKFLPQITFESPLDRLKIQEKGVQKWKANEVSSESLDLGNRFIEKMEASYLPIVSVRWVNETLGYGLFLEENIEAGSYVGEYTGVIRKNRRDYFRPLNNYCYDYPVADNQGRNYVIDATDGHLTRFINHSFHPNLQRKYAFYDGFYHAIFLAIDNLEKGTQLSFNYGYSYWHIRKQPIIVD